MTDAEIVRKHIKGPLGYLYAHNYVEPVEKAMLAAVAEAREQGRREERKALVANIGYWSYCTWEGMFATCPEKREELKDWLGGLGLYPYTIHYKSE